MSGLTATTIVATGRAISNCVNFCAVRSVKRISATKCSRFPLGVDAFTFQFHVGLLHALINEEIDQLVGIEKGRQVRVKFKKQQNPNDLNMFRAGVLFTLRELGFNINLAITDKGEQYEIVVED